MAGRRVGGVRGKVSDSGRAGGNPGMIRKLSWGSVRLLVGLENEQSALIRHLKKIERGLEWLSTTQIAGNEKGVR